MKRIALLVFPCLMALSMTAQVAINTDGSNADASAVLDLQSTTRGLLIPRMNVDQREAIVSPATGLLVFDPNASSFYVYDGSLWVTLKEAMLLSDTDGDTKIQVEETIDEDIIRFDVGGTEGMVLSKNAAGHVILHLPSAASNTFVGESAGNANTTGSENTAVGKGALQSNTEGDSNTAIGQFALGSNTTGQYNSATGNYALHSNTEGYLNVANGFNAMFNNTIGNENTAVGMGAMYNNTEGSGNTALGKQAMNFGTSGNSNTAVGLKSLFKNTSDENTVLGAEAMFENTTGYSNTAVGALSLRSNTTGFYNTASGSYALHSNTEGYLNVANGFNAMFNNTIGNENTAVGMGAMYNNMEGSGNTALGKQAMNLGASGNSNTAVGLKSLFNNSGDENTALGAESMYTNTIGEKNTAVGAQSLRSNTVGSYNTANGFYALSGNISGTYNTAIGDFALSANSTGMQNTAMGALAYFTTDNLSNTTAIGYFAGGISNVNNRIEVGNTSVSWIGGQVTWSTYSDARIKTGVQENVPGLAFINLLRPVTYHLDIHKMNDMCLKGKKPATDWEEKYDIEQQTVTGFLAQEVEAAARTVGYNFSGVEKAKDEVGLYSVRYSDFVMPLVKAAQELDAKNKSLEQQVAAQQTTIDAMQKLLLELQAKVEGLEAGN